MNEQDYFTDFGFDIDQDIEDDAREQVLDNYFESVSAPLDSFIWLTSGFSNAQAEDE